MIWSGTRRAWLRLSNYLRRAVSRIPPRPLLYVLDLPSHATRPQSRVDVRFREVEADEVARNPHEYAKNIEPRSDWIRLRGRCVAGLLDGRVVYHMWYRRAERHQLGGLPASWQPQGRALLFYDCFTIPELRGRGIHTAAVNWLVEREHGGCTLHVVANVNSGNVAACRALRRLRFKSVGETPWSETRC